MVLILIIKDFYQILFKNTFFVDKFKLLCKYLQIFEYIQIIVNLWLIINLLCSPIFAHDLSRAQKQIQ